MRQLVGGAMRVWRICKRKYAETAFDGEGALRAGGRWNSPGRAMVYTSEHLSLAAMELLVHILSVELVPPNLVAIPAEVPDELFGEPLGEETLPEGWRDPTGSATLRSMGDQWFDNAVSVARAVPSVVIPEERNVLINPEHPDFGRLDVGAAREFELDSRFFR